MKDEDKKIDEVKVLPNNPDVIRLNGVPVNPDGATSKDVQVFFLGRVRSDEDQKQAAILLIMPKNYFVAKVDIGEGGAGLADTANVHLGKSESGGLGIAFIGVRIDKNIDEGKWEFDLLLVGPTVGGRIVDEDKAKYRYKISKA